MVAFSCPFLGFLSIIGNMKMDALKFWHSKLCFCELKKISRQQYFLDFGKLRGCFQILTLNNPEWIWDPVQPDIYNAWNLISSFDLKLANLKRFQTLKSIRQIDWFHGYCVIGKTLKGNLSICMFSFTSVFVIGYIYEYYFFLCF